MNIKGTPAMPAAAVKHDLTVGRSEASVLVTQEFRWPWYWRTLKNVVGRGKWSDRWSSSPGFAKGFARPVRGAQSVMWDNKIWKHVDTRVRVLHDGHAGISEDRFIRAVLLQNRATGVLCWFLTTHFVVGGDEPGDGPLRKKMMALDLRVLDTMVEGLRETGYAIIGQFDGNIHRGTPAYRELMDIASDNKMTFHGEHGVEYLFTVDGEATKVQVLNDWVVPTSRLKTDHEGRGITYRLIRS